MSHHSVAFSPVGTPVSERTVGELVSESPNRSRIFQRHHIDFCCQGGRTLREACERSGVSLDLLTAEIAAADAGGQPTAFNPAELPIDELSTYIVDTHHAFLRAELPRIHAMAERVARVHGPHTPSLVEVFQVFCELEHELTGHMMKEEGILFPAARAIARDPAAAVGLDGPVACMIHEHDLAGRALARIRELTRDHTPPADACNTYRALFAGLAELETDLHRHIHLENHVLFPAVLAVAA